jgi:hypothetical protein
MFEIYPCTTAKSIVDNIDGLTAVYEDPWVIYNNIWHRQLGKNDGINISTWNFIYNYRRYGFIGFEIPFSHRSII